MEVRSNDVMEIPLPLVGEGARRAGEGKNILKNAKFLRQNMTEAEQKLWYYLRGKRFVNVKFKRQKPIGSYVVDFVSINKKVIVELDGSQHLEQQEYDETRSIYLESLGYKVLRFWNHDCLIRTEIVLQSILNALEPSPAPSGHPLP